MTSTTWPHGLERPIAPRSSRPLPFRGPVPPSEVGDELDSEPSVVRPSHVAAWCLGGSIGWAALIGAAWVAVDVLAPIVR